MCQACRDERAPYKKGDRVIVHPAGKRLAEMHDGDHGEVVGVVESGALKVALDGFDHEHCLMFAPANVEPEA